MISTSTQSEALIVESWGRSQSRRSHKFETSGSRSKLRSKSKTRNDFNYYHCGKAGHIIRHCRYLKREKSRKRDKDKDKENDKDTITIAYDDVLIVYHENFENLACDDSSWIMDFGASCHVTPRCDFFSSYTAVDFGTIKMKGYARLFA